MSFWKTALNVVTGGIGGTVASIAGDALSSLFGKSDKQVNQTSLDQQAKYQKEMIDYQNQTSISKEKEMIDYQNEATMAQTEKMWNKYQSPQAIMTAYKQAGINPNLVAGQVSGNGSATLSATSSGGSSAPSGQGYQDTRMAFLQNILQSVKISNEMKYQSAQIKLLNEQVESAKIANERALLDNDVFKNEITAPEFDVPNEDYSPDRRYSTLSSRNQKTRKATKEERLLRGLDTHNSRYWHGKGIEYEKYLVAAAGDIARNNKDILDSKWFEESYKEANGKEKLIYPLVKQAMQMALDYDYKNTEFTKLRNEVDLSYTQINELIDELPVPGFAKRIFKVIIGLADRLMK